MLKIFFAIFLTVNTFSFFNYPHNRKGVTINMDQFDPSQVALKSGESAKVSGSICVAKYHTITNKAKCYKLKKGNLPVRFYFPDKNTEVTNDVTFSEKGNDYSFLYSTPELVKNSENKFIVVVAEDNNRIKHLEQTQAKLNKRILFLKDRVLFFQNKPHHEKVVAWLNHLLSILESTSRKLDKLFDEDPSILATMEYPLQVDNEYASVFRYSTFFSGHKISLEIDNGSVIDGEKTKILAKTVNLSHLSFWFPDIGDSDDGDDESFKSDGLNDYKLVINHDSKEIFDSGFINLNFGSDISKTIEISSIDYLNNNNFEVLLYKNRKSFFFFNKFFQTLYGSISHDLNVAIDTTVPLISNVIPENTLKYAQNLEKIEAIISDNFGRINPSSIVLSHSFQGETSNVEVTKTELDFERKVKISKALGTISEGDHEFKIQASDYAGNEAVETRSLKIDRTPPAILLGASGNILTNNPVFKIPVQITDASPVEVSIIHNGAIIEFLNDAEFERDITLLEGMNDIEIMAKDAAGNIASQKLEGIELDTIAPTLLSLSPEEGSIINELSLPLRFTFSEKISEIIINNNSIKDVNSSVFEVVQNIEREGEFLVNVKIIDFAGNFTEATKTYTVLLRPLREELISIIPDPENSDKLIVIGANSAAVPNNDVKIRSGFFTSDTIKSEANGSFRKTINFTNSVIVESTHPITNETGKYEIKYNIETTFSGIVKNVYDEPIPNVKVIFENSEIETTTGADGVFEFKNAPTGDHKLLFDATSVNYVSSSGVGHKYSKVAIALNLGLRQRNVLERPIYLTPSILDESSVQVLPENGATVTSEHAPGVVLEIPPDTIEFPSQDFDRVSIMEIPIERTSVSPPDYVIPETVIALEPSGTKFKERIKLTLPNVNELPEGTELVILSKNSEKGIWEIDGAAKVDDGGATITTQEGKGISHFSEVFAVPIVPHVFNPASELKPGANTNFGSVSKTINLPSFKILGNDISPSLSYNSNWASPKALVSNTIAMPDFTVHFSDSQSGGIPLISYAKQGFKYKEWIEPSWISAQFFADGIYSQEMKYQGAPNVSTIAYNMDLSSLSSGIHSYSAKYKYKLKRMTISTFNYRKSGILTGNVNYSSTYKETRELEKLFPSDVSGPLYILNKGDSSLGSGWKFNIGSRILNPTEDRILIESQEGSLAQYNLNSKIETVFRTQSSLEGVTLSFPKIYYSKNNKIYSSDLTNSDTETEVSDLYKYSGSFGVHKSLWGGKCGICHLYRHPFTLSSIPNKFLHNPSDGITYYTADNGGIFSVDNGLSQKFGNTRTPSSTGINWQLAWTSYPDCRYGYPGLSCSGIYEYGRYSNSSNNCGCNGSSGTGSWPVNGFSDGEITSSLFNNPKDIIPSFSGGKIAIADYGNNRVRLLDPSLNTVTTIAGSGQNFDNGDGGAAIDASIYHPQALAYDKVGNLYIATENGYIRKVTPNGYISTFAGRPLGAGGGKLDYDVHASELGLTIPSDIIIDSESQYMYISDTGNHRVIKLDMNTLQAKTIAGGSCVGDSSSADSIVGDNASALGASLCNPKDLSFDSGGNLLVYDSGHGRVRRIVENVSNEFGTSFIPVLSDGSSLNKNVDGSFSLNLRDGRNIQYDNLGREILSDDKNGNSVSYEYEDNLLKRVNFLDRGNLYFNYSGGLLTSVVDHSGKETFFEYSGRQLVKVVFPDGSENNFSYTEDNHLTQSVDPAGRITNFIYNQNKSLVELKTPDGFSQKVNNILDEKSGNTILNGEYGELLSTAESKVSVNFTNPLNNTTTIFKDVEGFVSKFKDAQGKLTQIERDLEGRPLKITRPDNSTVDFEYAPITFDLIRKLDSSTGIEVKYVYNEAGLLLKTLENDEIIEENVYNELNQLISKTNRLGQKVQYEYNSLGLVVKKIAPDLSFATFSYDAFGNIETSTDASGKVTTFTRDTAGNVISISNAEGQVVTREYDEFNRLLSVTSNKNEKTSYVYSPTGQLLSIVDPNLKVTSFEYDAMDRLIKKVDPVGRVVTLEYDANGNVTKEIDPAGNVKTFAYNKLDKLVKKVLPDDVYEFDYDIRGNVKMVKNNITQINFEYDHLESGDVVTVAGTFGIGSRADLPSMDLEYEYDNHGNRTALIDGDEVTSYEYDIGDRLRKITNHKNEVFAFSYDAKNRLSLITRPGSETAYNFYDNDILSQILHKSGATTISNVEYQVNNIGNITQKRTPAGNFDYGYDGNNQLTSATNPETILDEVYQYDSLGNRTQDQNGSYTYDQTGQKLQEDYKNFYYYDNNGNLTSIIEKGTNRTKNFFYSSENRLMGYKEFDEQANLIRSANYAYDGLGRRIEKVVTDLQVPANNKTRRYVYDGEDILIVLDENNAKISKYTHSSLRIDDALAIDNKQDDKSYYFLKDRLGSIIDIVNDELSFKQHYAYSSFGELQKVTDISGNDITANPILEHHFAYTGREYDQESGLYHYRARAYDSSTGRFLQVDPDAGIARDNISVVNKMVYVSNNPMSFVDPKGEFKLRSFVVGGLGYALLRDKFFRDSKFFDRLEKTGIAIAVLAVAFHAAPVTATFSLVTTIIQNRNKEGNFFDNLDEMTMDFSFTFGFSYALSGGKDINPNGKNTLLGYLGISVTNFTSSMIFGPGGVIAKETACRNTKYIPKDLIKVLDPVGAIADRGKDDCI